MSTLKPNEMRAAMASCLMELRAHTLVRGVNESADKRLADLITQYMDSELQNSVSGAVEFQLNQMVETNGFHHAIMSALVKEVPAIVKSAAIAAITKVPLSKIMNTNDGDESIAHLSPMSLAEMMGEIARAHIASTDDHNRLVKAFNVLAVQHNDMRKMLAELLAVCVNDGGSCKVFTSATGDVPDFFRRKDLEPVTADDFDKFVVHPNGRVDVQHDAEMDCEKFVRMSTRAESPDPPDLPPLRAPTPTPIDEVEPASLETCLKYGAFGHATDHLK